MIAAAVMLTLPAAAPTGGGTPPTTSSQPASRPASEDRDASAAKSAPDPQPARPIKNIFLPYVPTEYTPPTPEVPELTLDGGLVLTGLVVNAGRFEALLEDKQAGRGVFLTVGDRIGAWRVERIETSRLIVRKEEGASLVVELGGTLSASLPPEPAPEATGTAVPASRGPEPPNPRQRSVEERMRRRSRAERRRF